MKRILLALVAALALTPAAASASTVTIGPALPLSGTTVNGVPCPSFGPDCWWANIQLPPGGIVEAPQNGTITSWKAEGLAGKAEPLVLKQISGTDTFSIVSEGSEVSEPCGGTGAQCDGGTAVNTFSADLPIVKGEFFGIRVISAPGCISQPAGSGCSVIGGASDQGINGGTGAATQPVGTPTSANDDPDSTIAIDATEQASGGNQPAFGGVSLHGTQTEQVISTQGAQDAHATASCEAGLVSGCSGSFVISVCVTTQNKAQAPSKASSSCDQYLRNFATAAGTKPAYHLLALGKTSFKLASGTKKTIAIPLTKTAKRLLAKWHTLRTVVVATAREGKTTKVSSRDVTLKLKH